MEAPPPVYKEAEPQEMAFQARDLERATDKKIPLQNKTPIFFPR
ncbi:MAG: hypothetical protein AAFS12_09435 [Cyanobacteria bacterium J06632_19]